MKKQKKIWNKIIFIIGLLLVSYPLVSSMIERQHQKDAVATYQGSIEAEDKSQIQDAIAKASEYNDMLFQTQGASIGDLQNGILSEENYENLLNLSGTGVMGSIEIPKINVDIPIYHGTSEEVLASGVGHFQDSSLPVGGNNTRCILTGHRGLPNSKLFTRLDELEKEALFFISTCGETLAYRITEIEVMEPGEAELLEILPEKDLCTLITCTPYGINTQRLVITGERVPYEKAEYDSIERKLPSFREAFFMVLPFIFMMAGLISFFRRKRHGKKNEQ